VLLWGRPRSGQFPYDCPYFSTTFFSLFLGSNKVVDNNGNELDQSIESLM
jgi:hypothetical protein